jgi:hypothetical protein
MKYLLYTALLLLVASTIGCATYHHGELSREVLNEHLNGIYNASTNEYVVDGKKYTAVYAHDSIQKNLMHVMFAHKRHEQWVLLRHRPDNTWVSVDDSASTWNTVSYTYELYVAVEAGEKIKFK